MGVKQVIVIRKDLNMRKGKMCSQAAHASIAIFFNRFKKVDENNYLISSDANWDWEAVRQWIEGAFTKITLSCNSEEELLELYNKAKEAKLPVSIIYDNGNTEFHGVKTLTAIAIGPDYSDKIDKITGDLSLL
jgi:peptidyl-tRNA hydrolase, PTH2 family